MTARVWLPRLLGALGALGVAATASAHPHDPVAARAPEEIAEPGEPSLATMAPLGAGRTGMSVGGGVAVILPFYEVELGYGLGDRVDLVAHYETVVGVLHYPHLGVRWAPVDFGRWTLGTRLTVNYSFFGIQTDNVNLTSVLYLGGEVGLSGPITGGTDLVTALGAEFDLYEYDEVDDEGSFGAKYEYDATIVRFGIKTKLTSDLDGFLLARLRVPVETIRYEAQDLYIVPFIEVGGTWSW